jgi:S1-C subfamily serine protease
MSKNLIMSNHNTQVAIRSTPLIQRKSVQRDLSKETRNIFNRINPACCTIYARFGNSVSSGSGTFISRNGYILTASHVISRNNRSNKAQEVYVFYGNNWYLVDNKTIYMDGVADIAILKINIRTNRYLSISRSDAQIGDTVYICGNPLGLDSNSLSKGVVRDCNWTDPYGVLLVNCLLIDTAGYSGNSGGAIINTSMQIVGLYTFGFGDFECLGGGVTREPLRTIVRNLVRYKTDYVTKKYLGIDWYSPIPFVLKQLYKKTVFPNQGVIISDIDKQSPFYNILKKNDILLKINNTKLGTQRDQRTPGIYIYSRHSRVNLQVFRPGKGYRIFRNVKLNKTYKNVSVTLDTPLANNRNDTNIRIIQGRTQEFETLNL